MRFLTLLLLLTTSLSFGYVQRLGHDIKQVTQASPRLQEIDNAILAAAARLKLDHAGPTSAAAVTISTFLAQPDLPRNITITPGGTTADVGAGDIIVTGTNIYGATITETVAVAANASAAVATTKAFKSVTSVLLPGEDSPFGATWSIGVGDVLGLDRCMDGNNVLFATFVGVYETTRPTVTFSATAVESNTVDINGTLDGAKDIDLYYIENYSCKP